MRCVLLPVNGPPREETISGWRDIGRLVGGYFEHAPTPGAPFIMYVNEEGKLHRLPFNQRATLLANRWRTWSDPLVGDVVLLGLPTSAGDETEFTWDEWEALNARDPIGNNTDGT